MTDVLPYANPLANNPLQSREDAQNGVRDLVRPLVPHFSEGRARVRLGSFAAWFSQTDAEFEGYARPLWGLAPLAAGGGEFAHWDLWREGLMAGTDRDHPEHWSFYSATQQTMVEQAALGVALMMARAQIWDPQPDAVKDNAAAWLNLINESEPFENNWHFFRVMVNLGLAAVGRATDDAATERSLNLLDSFYLGGGWYEDGPNSNRDHYIGWAFHVYGLIYAWARPDDPRSATYRERAIEFAQDFQHWFAPDGGVLPFGRSLTYRFAAASFWGALALANVEALPWGRIKGIWFRHLRWWRQWPISDRDGVLSIGWGYANMWMRENYNSSGSPYWALKAFLPLALPETHPFWTAEEEPADTSEHFAAQHYPGMIVSNDATQTVALSGAHSVNGFSEHSDAKYTRFAYSSQFALSVATSDPFGFGESPTESMITFAQKGSASRGRLKVDAHAIEGTSIYSRWRPMPGVTVHTVLTGQAPWHVRVHRIETEHAVESREGGFALGCVDVGRYTPEMNGGEARAQSAFGCTAIRDIDGERVALILPQGPNANLLYPRTVVPVLVLNLEPGTHDLACAVFASDRTDRLDWAPALAAIDTARDVLNKHVAMEPA